MGAQELLDKLMPKEDRFFKKDNRTPEERVEEALQKALDNDKPDRPGTPWGVEEEDGRDEWGEWL